MTYELLDAVDVARELLPEGQYQAKVADVALHTYKGRVPSALTSEFSALLLTKAGEPTTEREGKFLRHVFTVDPEGMFPLSDLLFTNLSWFREEGNEVDWIAEIRKGLPQNSRDLHMVLKEALEVGAVQYVLQQQPQDIPVFLHGILDAN